MTEHKVKVLTLLVVIATIAAFNVWDSVKFSTKDTINSWILFITLILTMVVLHI